LIQLRHDAVAVNSVAACSIVVYQRAMLAVVENGSLNDSGSGSNSNSNSNSNSVTSSAYRHSSTGGDQDLDRPASFRVNRQRHPSMNSINEDDPTATAPFTTATNTLSKVEDV